MDRWEDGFTTQEAIFAWITSSCLYDPARMVHSEAKHTGGRKVRETRGMYQRFLTYARQQQQESTLGWAAPVDRDTVVQSALQFFGKWDLYCRILRVASAKTHASTNFTGKHVTQWTGVQGVPVRFVMDEVKRRLGGEELDVPQLDLQDIGGDPIDPVHWTLVAWQVGLEAMDNEAIRAFTVQVKEDLQKNGKLEFNWREAKERRAERKQQQQAAAT